MITLMWSHPPLGRIVEVVCPVHEREVRAALDVLGVGHSGRPEPAGGCRRGRSAGIAPGRLLRARFGGAA